MIIQVPCAGWTCRRVHEYSLRPNGRRDIGKIVTVLPDAREERQNRTFVSSRLVDTHTRSLLVPQTLVVLLTLTLARSLDSRRPSTDRAVIRRHYINR